MFNIGKNVGRNDWKKVSTIEIGWSDLAHNLNNLIEKGGTLKVNGIIVEFDEDLFIIRTKEEKYFSLYQYIWDDCLWMDKLAVDVTDYLNENAYDLNNN